ncbi:hypothetical protein EGW08_005217 [Elysia chlorotica]|uniref:Uncharacterized protein n=1 Tax=Elysia chlorotica TaxID=188477 RepID=A0A3S1C9Z1_ELYCH|nr:hypothetical protein EGW08_005217 [Elysia chlorotica]
MRDPDHTAHGERLRSRPYRPPVKGVRAQTIPPTGERILLGKLACAYKTFEVRARFGLSWVSNSVPVRLGFPLVRSSQDGRVRQECRAVAQTYWTWCLALTPRVNVSLCIPVYPCVPPRLTISLCIPVYPCVSLCIPVCRPDSPYPCVSLCIASCHPDSPYPCVSLCNPVYPRVPPRLTVSLCIPVYRRVPARLTVSLCIPVYPCVSLCIPVYRRVSAILTVSLCMSVSLCIPVYERIPVYPCVPAILTTHRIPVYECILRAVVEAVPVDEPLPQHPHDVGQHQRQQQVHVDLDPVLAPQLSDPGPGVLISRTRVGFPWPVASC